MRLPKTIVCIGECMVEMSPMNDTGGYRLGFAGDTFNTAWYLARLFGDRAKVKYFTALGTDSVSEQMLQFMTKAGVVTSSIPQRLDRTPGLYMIQLQDGERSFNYWRSDSAARTLAQSDDEIATALSSADVAYFSGITLAILPPSDRKRLCAALAQFRSAGGLVVFDPNLRPKLWDSPQDMTQSVMEAARLSDIVLPSFEDEATWFEDHTIEDTAQRYVQQGAQIVVVKNGAGAIALYSGAGLSHHEPVKVINVVDTTAAGDSFNAGFLASHLDGHKFDHSISVAARLSARVIANRGALVEDAVAVNVMPDDRTDALGDA